MKRIKSCLFLMALLFVFVFTSCNKTTSSESPTPATPSATIAIASFTPASGKAGTEVTINGTGFGTDINAVGVTFGSSSSVKPKSVSATQIIVIVPTSAKTGKIGLSINNGAPVYSSDSFTFIDDPNAYIVKTVGITRIRYATLDNKLTLAEILGGGNRIIIKAGSDQSMEFVNANNTVPVVEQYPDASPDAFYNSPSTIIDNANPPDTNGVVIKIKGFNKSVTGYNQLNLVVCYDTKLSADKNVIMITHTGALLDRSKYNDSFFKQLFSTNISVTNVELAPPLSASSYIIRDVIVTGLSILLDSAFDHPIKFQAGEVYNFGAKFNLDPLGKINVGGQIKTELVNTEKGTMSFVDPIYPDFTFSNIKSGGFDHIVEPADSINKVFIRMTGFSPEICGFNQLRLFLTKDPSLNSGTLGYVNEPPRSLVTLPFILKTFKTNNLTCIQLYVR